MLDLGNRETGEATSRGKIRGVGESLAGTFGVGVPVPSGLLSFAGVPLAVSAIESAEARATMEAGTPDFAVAIVALRFASMSLAEDDIPSMIACKLAEPPCICSKLYTR
jgi:hypothetical protein